MSNIQVSSKVALLLKRVVNLVSGLSVSHQYLTRKSRGLSPDGLSNTTSRSQVLPAEHSSSRAEAVSSPKGTRATGTDLAASDVSASVEDTTASYPDPPAQNDIPQRSRRPQADNEDDTRKDTIHMLMKNPALYNPLRKPRYPIALCHGLYGFDVWGPESFPRLQVHYWSTILSILRDKLGAEVIVTSCPGTGSIISRSETLHEQLKAKVRGRGVNFLAHSMGGLDCRHLITHIKPTEYTPLSLTSVATPHRGSPFMDWCSDNIGIGKAQAREELLSRSRAHVEEEEADTFDAAWYKEHSCAPSYAERKDQHPETPPPPKKVPFSLSSLPSSFTPLLLSLVDSPAYNNLTTSYLQDVFNPNTPDDPRVKYFSVASRMSPVNVLHPFWLPKMVLDGVEERERGALRQRLPDVPGHDGQIPLWARESEWGNDGLVPIQSAKWGEFLGIIEGADHWEIRGARGFRAGVDSLSFIGSSNGDADGWGFKDWGRFVSAWKKEETRVQHAAAERSASTTVHDNEKEKEETILRSSAATLSSVFDWLTDHVPGSGMIRKHSDGLNQEKDYPEMKRHMDQVHDTPRRKENELESLEGLERFYVALTRKLYDEGL